MDLKDIQPDLLAVLEAERLRWNQLSEAVWKHPEIAYEEHFACQTQVDLLRSLGFHVTTPYCSLDTAYRAEYGSGGILFAFVAEYDALPGLGHGCGHNLICTAALAAFCAVARILEKYQIPGKIVLLGTPAEESGGGKVRMLEKGCLDDISASMMVHPSWRTTPDTGSSAIHRFDVVFTGKSAHAAAAPELGINALDAVLLLFNAVNAMRQQLPETCRVHGVVREGGNAPNIIPERASCRFFLRSTDEEWIGKLEDRFRKMVQGASLMTGAEYTITPFQIPYMSRNPNQTMNQAYFEIASRLGLNPVIPKRSARGSSDYGDFSHKRPGIHAYFGIAQKEMAAHSQEFAEAASSSYAFEQTLKAALAMAEIAVRYLTDSRFRTDVQKDFEEHC